MDGIELMAVFYRVEHETRYVYASSVSTSQHVAYLRPRELPRQRVHAHELVIDPAPARIRHRTDYFGNDAAYFELLRPHAELRAASRSVVEVRPRDGAIEPALSPAWEQARDALGVASAGYDVAGYGTAGHDAPAQFAYASPYVSIEPEVEAFGRASFPAGRPLLAGAIDLMRRIHDGFRFDPSATTIATPVTRVLAERHGVCQDFAHLQISCMRALGLAARYVSGYLLTDPPPGQPRLIGADASHAWLSVHCPRHGWVDLDPTNDLIVDQRHVTLAWGRDYGDVSPLFGVLLGGERHRLTVGVSVTPLPFAIPGSVAAEPAR
jgi:transglutaminase-like putative cysteine protease